MGCKSLTSSALAQSLSAAIPSRMSCCDSIDFSRYSVKAAVVEGDVDEFQKSSCKLCTWRSPER